MAKARRAEALRAERSDNAASETHQPKGWSRGRARRQQKQDVVALQTPQQPARPHLPMGCTFLFSPGWEADQAGGTAGLCTPVERDIFDCHISCSGRRRCQTCSITRPTGRASARRPRKTGGRSTSCFHDREGADRGSRQIGAAIPGVPQPLRE